MDRKTKHPFTMYLANGDQISSVYDSERLMTTDEVASALASFVSSLPKPSWMQLDNIVFFTGAVAAIEVEY